jgi:diguanylate cyclase (GGDEF)-like protein
MDLKKFTKLTPLSIALLYVLSGAIWIRFSNGVIQMLVGDNNIRFLVQNLKLWFFIGVNALFFYWLMKLAIRSLRKSEKELAQSYSDLEAVHEELVATQEELRQNYEEIQEREAYYSRVYEGISSGILVHNQEGRLIHANASAWDLLALEKGGMNQGTRMNGQSLPWYKVRNEKLTWQKLVQYLVRKENIQQFIEVLIHHGEKGQKRYLLAHSDLILSAQSSAEEIVTTFIDRTEEKKLEITNSILNEINQMVLKKEPLVHIGHTLCHRLLEELDFAIVCVVTKEDDGSLSFRAKAGVEGLEEVTLRWDDSVFAQGPAGKAIRLGKPQMDTMEGSLNNSVWSDFLSGHGIQAIAAFPLIHEGEVFGALALASYRLDRFEPKQMAMFEHCSVQIAMAFGYVKDQERLERYRNLLWHQAHHDALTKLPNRLLFHDHLRSAMDEAKRKQGKCGVLFLDLDRFKLINDTMGHNNGDDLLIKVAVRLSESLPKQVTIGRQGGDEFLIILPDLKEEKEAAILAQEILDCFKTPFLLESREVFVTTSIGISLFPDDGDQIDTLIKQADTAMYFAKERGSHYEFYTEELKGVAHERLDLENNLRKALERDEFIFHYQPVLNLENGQIVGMEALVRWQSPERGLVSPGVFIPIAEETGLIVQIGEQALREACMQNVAWQNRGYPPRRIAVNISARQFREPQFVERVVSILNETGLEPQWLELEITESIAMEQGEVPVQQLQKLKELGIQIAIDDFGTGYSSLNCLRRLPIDHLKVDQSFIREIGKESNGEAIIRTLIQMAKDLKLKVTAEGVETVEQFHFLKKIGCDEIQGYFFSHPLPIEDLEVKLLTHDVDDLYDELTQSDSLRIS